MSLLRRVIDSHINCVSGTAPTGGILPVIRKKLWAYNADSTALMERARAPVRSGTPDKNI